MSMYFACQKSASAAVFNSCLNLPLAKAKSSINISTGRWKTPTSRGVYALTCCVRSILSTSESVQERCETGPDSSTLQHANCNARHAPSVAAPSILAKSCTRQAGWTVILESRCKSCCTHVACSPKNVWSRNLSKGPNAAQQSKKRRASPSSGANEELRKSGKACCTGG